MDIRVQKTQISFFDGRMFACASFLRVRRARELPERYLVVTFGLDHKEHSPRILAAVEPYPGRWTHHVAISRTDEVDDELMGWLAEAAAFARLK